MIKTINKKNSKPKKKKSSKIFQEVITKAFKKQIGVACVIPFAPYLQL
jgi:hypothetical protein